MQPLMLIFVDDDRTLTSGNTAKNVEKKSNARSGDFRFVYKSGF